MKRILSIALLMAGAALLAGCPKKHNVNERARSPVPRFPGHPDATPRKRATSTSPLGGGGDSSARGLNGEGSGAAGAQDHLFRLRQVGDQAGVRRYRDRHARNLTSHPNLKMKLEGNTDERGTREYNIGLGERRAQAVRRALMLQGVAESQLTTVSFGAERPAVEGDDEAAWAKNRRVEMVYTQ